MKAITPAKELASLQWEINNCRKTILFLEDSLRNSDESIPKEDPRKDSIDRLLQTITEKDKQLRVIEDMLMHQKVVLHKDDETGAQRTYMMRKAIDNRMLTHKEELKKAKDYYYHLMQETKVA
jgi:predicted  nucleic acid-binding Zn-ribbon protein